MKGLSSVERIILESIGMKQKSYEQIKNETGLQENVCFNVLQALIIRGMIKNEKGHYQINNSLSPIVIEEINGIDAKKTESLELIEGLIENEHEKIFRFQKVALEVNDEKIFKAMLSNLESFLKDAHKKAENTTALKDRKVIFWGMGSVNHIIKKIMTGY